MEITVTILAFSSMLMGFLAIRTEIRLRRIERRMARLYSGSPL